MGRCQGLRPKWLLSAEAFGTNQQQYGKKVEEKGNAGYLNIRTGLPLQRTTPVLRGKNYEC